MTKGIGSKNSLKALAHPLQQFIGGWGAGQRVSGVANQNQLPAPYVLAALRGEAVLRTHFFDGFITKTNFMLDASQQVALWQLLVEGNGYITAWVQRLGIAKALRREATLSADTTQEYRTLYCILLDALNTQAPELLTWAVDAYFLHCYKAQFASNPIKQTSAPQPQVLREKLTRTLRGHYQEGVAVKESFSETEAMVEFSLLVKRTSIKQWEPLITLKRPRLKPARIAAYESVLSQYITI